MRLIEETTCLFVCLEQGFDVLAKLFIIPARAFDISGPLLWRGKLHCGLENLLFALTLLFMAGFSLYHTMRNRGSKRISNLWIDPACGHHANSLRSRWRLLHSARAC